MKNEKIVIFGDSYSTYTGYIPEGYGAYYPRENVEKVEQTWWYMLEKETESEIIQNNSWSGSTVCNTGYNGDCSQSSSFIHRLDVLIESGFFNENIIDRALVFGGTNDSWSGNAAGELIFDGWTPENLLLVLPGIAYFAYKLQTVLPKEKIHFIINTDLRAEISDGMVSICKHYGIGYTVLSNIDKTNGHPTTLGMAEIKEQVLASLN